MYAGESIELLMNYKNWSSPRTSQMYQAALSDIHSFLTCRLSCSSHWVVWFVRHSRAWPRGWRRPDLYPDPSGPPAPCSPHQRTAYQPSPHCGALRGTRRAGGPIRRKGSESFKLKTKSATYCKFTVCMCVHSSYAAGVDVSGVE